MKLKELINSTGGGGWKVELRGSDDKFIAQGELESTKLMPYYDCEIKKWFPGAGSQYSDVSMTVYLTNSKAREELLTAMRIIKKHCDAHQDTCDHCLIDYECARYFRAAGYSPDYWFEGEEE